MYKEKAPHLRLKLNSDTEAEPKVDVECGEADSHRGLHAAHGMQGAPASWKPPKVSSQTKVATTACPADSGSILAMHDIERLKLLGGCNVGYVWKVIDKISGTVKALKEIKLSVSKATRPNLEKEMKTFTKLKSPHIVTCYGASYDCRDGTVRFLLEYMDIGSMDNILARVGRFPEPVLRKVIVSLLDALTYLACSTIEMSVQPSKLLLNRAGQIKLGDFDVKCGMLQRKFRPVNKSYSAPEVFEGANAASSQANIWSHPL